MEASFTKCLPRSFMPAPGGGKQLRLFSAQDGLSEERISMIDSKSTNESANACDFVPGLSIEDDDFLSDLIPSPSLDELENIVYDMTGNHFLNENEVFETVTSGSVKSIINQVASATDGSFVRHPNEKDIISVRGFGKSRPGSLKFRELVRKHHHAYQRSDSLDFKRNLARKIWDELLPGRFLKKDYLNQNAYRVMDEEETLTKIMFAMRDCKTSAPIRRTVKGEDSDKTSVTLSEKVSKKPRVKREAASFVQGISSSPLGTRRSKLKKESATVEDNTLSSSSHSIQLNPKYLYEHEMEQLNLLFTDGVLCDASDLNSMLPSRANEIYILIKDVVTRATDIRLQETMNPNDEWFTAESQLKIRQQLLERCRAFMSLGQSPKDFFEHLSQLIFRDGPLALNLV